MVAIDTNIFVRLLTQDDDYQYQRAYTLFQHEELFLSKTVILETEWVLRYAYKFRPNDIILGFRRLFGLPNVCVEDAGTVALALKWHEGGLDFADALHLAASQRCDAFYTFDEDFVKKGNAVSECALKRP